VNEQKGPRDRRGGRTGPEVDHGGTAREEIADGRACAQGAHKART